MTETKTQNEVKSILVSQPKPVRSPYFMLEEEYDIKIDWRPFIHVEPVSEKEFRKQRIRPDEYSCVIFTSRNAIENYFRLSEEMRIKPHPENRYFCISESVGNYLQKFILYRKRKVFVGNKHIEDLKNNFLKYRKTHKFLLPTSNLGSKPVVQYLNKIKVDFQEALMFRTVSSDLSDLRDIKYDVLVFFSPLGIHSLYENFPDFEQNGTRIAVFGNSTEKAVVERGLTVNIKAPSPETPSMKMALEKYIQEINDYS